MTTRCPSCIAACTAGLAARTPRAGVHVSFDKQKIQRGQDDGQTLLPACSAEGVRRSADGRASISASTLSVVDRIASDIAEARALGVEVGVVDRRRQHLSRRRRGLQGRRPRHRRPHGHAGDRHQLAGAAHLAASSSTSTRSCFRPSPCRRSARAFRSARPLYHRSRARW